MVASVRVAVKYRRVLKSIKSEATTQRAPRRLHHNKINHRLALKCFIPTYLYTGRNIDGWINLNVGNTILLCGTPGGHQPSAPTRRMTAPVRGVMHFNRFIEIDMVTKILIFVVTYSLCFVYSGLTLLAQPHKITSKSSKTTVLMT